MLTLGTAAVILFTVLANAKQLSPSAPLKAFLDLTKTHPDGIMCSKLVADLQKYSPGRLRPDVQTVQYNIAAAAPRYLKEIDIDEDIALPPALSIVHGKQFKIVASAPKMQGTYRLALVCDVIENASVDRQVLAYTDQFTVVPANTEDDISPSPLDAGIFSITIEPDFEPDQCVDVQLTCGKGFVGKSLAVQLLSSVPNQCPACGQPEQHRLYISEQRSAEHVLAATQVFNQLNCISAFEASDDFNLEIAKVFKVPGMLRKNVDALVHVAAEEADYCIRKLNAKINANPLYPSSKFRSVYFLFAFDFITRFAAIIALISGVRTACSDSALCQSVLSWMAISTGITYSTDEHQITIDPSWFVKFVAVNFILYAYAKNDDFKTESLKWNKERCALERARDGDFERTTHFGLVEAYQTARMADVAGHRTDHLTD